MKKTTIILIALFLTSIAACLAQTLDETYGCSADMSDYPSSGEGSVMLFENCTGIDGTSMDGRVPQITTSNTAWSVPASHAGWQIKNAGSAHVCRSVNVDSDDDRLLWDMPELSHNFTAYFTWNATNVASVTVSGEVDFNPTGLNQRAVLIPYNLDEPSIYAFMSSDAGNYFDTGIDAVANKEHHVMVKMLNTGSDYLMRIWVDGEYTGEYDFPTDKNEFELLWINTNYNSEAPTDMRYFLIINGTGNCTPAQQDTIPPLITLYNCTSCNIPYGDTTEPFETEDTTPTFRITTDENSVCAIADIDKNYTSMVAEDSSRNCSTTGSTEHICTLPPSDELLINETDYVYFACIDTNDNENSSSNSGPKQMQMTSEQTEEQGELAIQAGIDTSVISGAVVYTGQKVYLRDINNNQISATFDKFVISGDQRWAFNYITSGESPTTGLFNLTPSFYAAEYQDMSFQEINNSVRTLIDNTKI